VDQNPQVSIIVPAYNEQAAICDVLDGIATAMDAMGEPYEIIVVDDGSQDDTALLCASRPSVRVIRHSRNRGTGAARTTGVRAARAERLVMIDADGTYPADRIPAFVQALDECDMIIGARDREMGTMPWLRRLAKDAIRLLASYMTETPIPDLNSGLRAMKRSRVLEFLHLLPNSHSWVSTITMAFLSSGYEVRWMPITYHRRVGRSSFHPITDTYNYVTLVVRAIMYFNPLRLFLPVSLGMLAVGVLKAIHDIFRYHFHFAPSTVILVLGAVQVGAMGLLADLIVKQGRRPPMPPPWADQDRDAWEEPRG